MATISFQLIGNTDYKSIYVSLSMGRNETYKKNTGYKIKAEYWSKDKNRPKQTLSELKNLKTGLDNLQTSIYKNLNMALEKKEVINADWLQKQIDALHGNFSKDESNKNLLIPYFEYYIEKLPNKVNTNANKGVSTSTIQKYSTIQKIVSEYEKHAKKTIRVYDVNNTFQTDFIKFLQKQKNYSENYIGRIIRFIKTVCNDAKNNGIETNPQLNMVRGYKIKIDKIYLTQTDLQKIENTDFTREALENAKDWLLIGCYLGQRVSDLLKLTPENITMRSGTELIEIEQQKTKKLVVIPLFPEIKEILNKRNGEFPYKISDQKFNEYIKEVAKLSGLDTPTKGAKMNPETKRKEYGTFPKWELVTSHICRRSFATNYYGEIPTPLLISVTGHSTETQFLEYIGKTSTEQAIQLAEYWTQGILKAQKKPVLTVIKKAN